MGQKTNAGDGAVNSPESIRIRSRFILGLLIIVGVVLGGRFFYIQVLQRDYYLKEARRIYTKKQIVTGQRGEIFDRNGNLLVANSPRLNVECSPYNVVKDEDRRRLAWILAQHFPEKNYREYYKRLDRYRYVAGDDGKLTKRKNQYFLVKRNASLERVQLLKKSLAPTGKKDKRLNLLRVVTFSPGVVRAYPKGRMLANLLGYVDIENDTIKPRNGLEKRFDHTMTPEKIRNVYERTPSGHPISFANNKIFVPANGKDIYLTIIEPLQAILEEELNTVVEEWHPEGVFAAIADPRSGEILAIAQRPTFDPGDRTTYKNAGAVRMRYAQDIYEPGSLAKPFSVLYALERKLVTPEDKINCEKGRWHEKKLTDVSSYDMLTVSDVIKKSSNIGTAKIAMMLGKEGVYHALTRFGFHTRSGLPFTAEQRGFFLPPARWDSLAITRIPIGYSFSTTLLQLLRAYCGLANNGKLPYLKLIHGIRDPETGNMELVPHKGFKETGADPVQLYKLIDMMISVTAKDGTARRAAIPGFQVAGKTGTSRKNIEALKDPVTGKIIRKSGYSTSEYYTSFAGFVPAHDPRLVMVITVDNPRGGKGGGAVAAPVFRRTMERALRYLNVQPTEPFPEPVVGRR